MFSASHQLGLDVIRVLGLVALLRPDLPLRLTRHELRHLAAGELLAVRLPVRQLPEYQPARVLR